MVSALGQNDCYNRYISAFLEWLLRVTAELISLVPIRYRVCGPTDRRSVKTHDRQHSITSGAFGRQNHPSSHSMTNPNIFTDVVHQF